MKNAQNQATQVAYEKKEACGSALWLTGRIDSMENIMDLVETLSYIAPYTLRSTVSDENKKTISRSISIAFGRYYWKSFRGGTHILLFLSMRYANFQ